MEVKSSSSPLVSPCLILRKCVEHFLWICSFIRQLGATERVKERERERERECVTERERDRERERERERKRERKREREW